MSNGATRKERIVAWSLIFLALVSVVINVALVLTNRSTPILRVELFVVMLVLMVAGYLVAASHGLRNVKS